MEQLQLQFPISRNSDPTTSHIAAEAIRPKAGTQLYKLLVAYSNHPEGLTDEEAGEIAGIRNGYWKRCSDLRNAQYIVATGQTRTGSSGLPGRVCKITDSGTAVL